jgi:hypothetical protein
VLIQFLKDAKDLKAKVKGKTEKLKIHLLNIRHDKVRALEEVANKANSATGITWFTKPPLLLPRHEMPKKARTRHDRLDAEEGARKKRQRR